MAIPTRAIPQGISWQDERFERLHTEIDLSRNFLGAELTRDVQPVDLCIGGTAIKDMVDNRNPDSYWRIGGKSLDTSVAIEAWAMDGDQVVQVKRGITNGPAAIESGMLANQVRDAYGWIPGARERRTAKVAAIAASSEILVVNFFETDHTPKDDDFRRFRQAATIGKSGIDGFRGGTVRIRDNEPMPLNKKSVVHVATSLIQTGLGSHRMADYVTTEDPHTLLQSESVDDKAIRRYSQDYVDQQLDRTERNATMLLRAASIVRGGTRIRPSKPLHDV